MTTDRLTHHVNGEVTTNVLMSDILYRLAEYEDIGYSVDELKSLLERKLLVDKLESHVTEERYNEICEAERENRLIILKYKIGQTIYVADYNTSENFLSPIPYFMGSPFTILEVMYDDRRKWFTSIDECQKYCDSVNNT